MEEERARQEAAAKEASKQNKESTSQDINMTDNPLPKTNDPMDDENALLQEALAMSMDPSTSHISQDTDISEAVGDDQDLALSLQLSMQESSKEEDQADMSKLLADQSFVSSILTSLPGVDQNDPSVRDFLASMQTQSESEQK